MFCTLFSLQFDIQHDHFLQQIEYLEKFNWQPLKIQNGQFHTYCINMYGTIYHNKKGEGPDIILTLCCISLYPCQLYQTMAYCRLRILYLLCWISLYLCQLYQTMAYCRLRIIYLLSVVSLCILVSYIRQWHIVD